MKCVNHGLGGPFAKYAAQTLYMVAGSKAVEDKERGYAHPMAFATKRIEFRIPSSMSCTIRSRRLGGFVDAAILQIEGAPFWGFPVLRWSDRIAPMPFADTHCDSVRTRRRTSSPLLMKVSAPR